LAISINKY